MERQTEWIVHALDLYRRRRIPLHDLCGSLYAIFGGWNGPIPTWFESFERLLLDLEIVNALTIDDSEVSSEDRPKGPETIVREMLVLLSRPTATGRETDVTRLRVEGLWWARSSLRGGLRLSSCVLRCASEFADWTLLTAPSSATEREGFRLGRGGVTRLSASSAVLLRAVSALGLERPLLIVEDDLARPTDPAIRSRAGDSLRCGEQVYHQTRSMEDAETLRRFLGTSASGYPLNAFLLDDRGGDLLPPGTELGDEDFRRLARHTALVIVSALDGEAWLLWPRGTVAADLRAWFAEER